MRLSVDQVDEPVTVGLLSLTRDHAGPQEVPEWLAFSRFRILENSIFVEPAGRLDRRDGVQIPKPKLFLDEPVDGVDSCHRGIIPPSNMVRNAGCRFRWHVYAAQLERSDWGIDVMRVDYH